MINLCYSLADIVSDVSVLSNSSLLEMLDPEVAQYLHYEFHSADHHTLTEVVNGLKTAVGFLTKVYRPD